MTETDKVLWAVNVQGPDDLIAAADYETALKIANAFNDWWQRHIHAKPLDEKFDPRMWAIPVEWPHGDDSHASNLANPSSDYRGFIDFATSN